MRIQEDRLKQLNQGTYVEEREGEDFTQSSAPSSFQYTSKKNGVTGTIPDKVKQSKPQIFVKGKKLYLKPIATVDLDHSY